MKNGPNHRTVLLLALFLLPLMTMIGCPNPAGSSQDGSGGGDETEAPAEADTDDATEDDAGESGSGDDSAGDAGGDGGTGGDTGTTDDGSGGAGSDPAGDSTDQSQTGGPEIRVTFGGDALSDGDTVDFGQITQNDGSATETITVHNDGDEALTFSKIEIGGNNGEDTTDPSNESGTFHWSASPETGALAAGESRELEIVIRHSSIEVNVSATLTIESNTEGDAASSIVINLKAEFVEAPIGLDPGV